MLPLAPELCRLLRFSHFLVALNLSFLCKMEVMPASLGRFLKMSEIMFVMVVTVTRQQRTVRLSKTEYSCHPGDCEDRKG